MADGPLERLRWRTLNSRVYEAARRTPLDAAPRLTRQVANRVSLKREDLQPVFSYKLRGAYNRLAHLSEHERASGVVAASAGNHAQGVAYAAKVLGIAATIVMPRTTPAIKIAAVGALGAGIVLHGDSYTDAQQHAVTLAEASGRAFVHPFDDELVIAGQGTVGHELRQQAPDLDAVFVPVGGGGLIAGIGAYLAASGSAVKVIGVEPYEADSMYRSLAAGKRVTLTHVGLFADGVAVRQVGALTFPVAQATVSEVVRVTNDQVCAAIRDVFNDTRAVVEPSGALAVAGMVQWVARTGVRGQHLACILSGANLNFDRLRFIAERADIGESREALFGVTIPERPGSFRRFYEALGSRMVLEFNYRLSRRDRAHIFVSVSTGSGEDAAMVAARLAAAGYAVTDFTNDEFAKLHVRYMVGGRASDASCERLCLFEFPERPGALGRFLEVLGDRWNVSLFHYRHCGTDVGHVAAAFEVAPGDTEAFDTFVADLGYPCQRFDRHAAYELFLC